MLKIKLMSKIRSSLEDMKDTTDYLKGEETRLNEVLGADVFQNEYEVLLGCFNELENDYTIVKKDAR